MADTERPGEAAKDEGSDPDEAQSTVGPNLPLQLRHNAEDAGPDSSPSDGDDEQS
jgi:hypothetical protein